MQKYVVVDVESDGGLLGENSMVCFGAVIVDKEGKLNKTFYGQTRPISEVYNSEALAISGFSRYEHENFTDPKYVFDMFQMWLEREIPGGNMILISDNNSYDASWINWYFLKFTGKNPFGWSSRRIGDMFCGFFNDGKYQWKKHRNYKFNFIHNHDPLQDAKSNAAALLYLVDKGFKLKL